MFLEKIFLTNYEKPFYFSYVSDNNVYTQEGYNMF